MAERRIASPQPIFNFLHTGTLCFICSSIHAFVWNDALMHASPSGQSLRICVSSIRLADIAIRTVHKSLRPVHSKAVNWKHYNSLMSIAIFVFPPKWHWTKFKLSTFKRDSEWWCGRFIQCRCAITAQRWIYFWWCFEFSREKKNQHSNKFVRYQWDDCSLLLSLSSRALNK